MKKTQEKGITLIALVITIIVMLILVGVTISVITNGGLIDQAKIAKTDTRVASYKEKIMAEIAAMKAASALEGGNIQDNSNLENALKRACGEEVQIIRENGKIIKVITKEGDEILLSNFFITSQQAITAASLDFSSAEQYFIVDGDTIKLKQNCYEAGCFSDSILLIPSMSATKIGFLSFHQLSSEPYVGSLVFNNQATRYTVIQSGITTIENDAFKDMTLFNVYIPASVTSISANAFGSFWGGSTIYCEAASKPAGWATGWNAGANVIWNATTIPAATN